MKYSIAILATLGIGGIVYGGINVFAEEMDTNVILAESAAISVPTGAVLNIQSSNAGSFGSTSFDVIAATNSQAGYTLTMSTTSTDLTSGANTIPALSLIEGGRTEEEFRTNAGDMNKWGISIDNTTSYNPIALSSDIKITDTATARDVTTINLGSKVNFDTPSGAYTTTINFAITVNMINPDFAYAYRMNGKTKTAQGYYRMQDMNADICAATEEHSEIQVQDIRDNKLYWILKAKDGKCWMTQNLDLDLETTPTNVAALTSENTDINIWNTAGYTASDGYSESGGIIRWTPTQSTLDASTNSFAWANNQNTMNTADVGDWFQISLADNYFNSSNCGEVNCKFIAGSGLSYFYQKSMSQASEVEKHYHVGNYYNWISAVASNTLSAFGTKTLDNPDNNPANSVCPKGWRLPIASSATNDDEFLRIINLYPSSDTDKKDLGVVSSPLYFIRGGCTRDNTLKYAGSSGGYYTSTVANNSTSSTAAKEESLDFNTTSIKHHNEQEGWRGRNLRCVAR